MKARTLLAALTAAASVFASFAFTSEASATTYSVYLHGRNTDGTPSGWGYWGGVVRPGINAVAVNYDGRAHISTANPTVRAGLNTYCSGSNSCYVACHSAGCAHLGYAIDKYGPYNIIWINAAGSAEGGTELSDVGSWAVGDALADDLKTGTVRGMYNHNNLRGVWEYNFAGGSDEATSWIVDGQDDGVVGYHSALGRSTTGDFCNPGDDWWLDRCNEVGMGTSTGSRFSYHYVYYRDDAESKDHYVGSGSGGIPSPMFSDMAACAN
ncbi:MAG: hypothetical protein AB7K71_02525 [Polyangiaceae bacterium]